MPAQTHPDLLGKAIREYWLTGEDRPVRVFINGIRDEDLSPSLFFRGYRQMRAWDRQALRLSRGSVLDVGAGAGSHSLALQHRGLDVTALDISRAAAKTMEERGVSRVMCDSIWNLRGIPYDTILLLMNGLGMAGTEAGTLRLLRHLKGLLTRDGQIIGDSTDILYSRMEALTGFQSAGRYYGEVEFVLEYGVYRSEPFPWVYLDPALLFELADKAGLRCEMVYRSPDFHYLARLTHQ